MKKNDLMNGDIVVTRNGALAVVIRNDHDTYLLYQTSGWESFDDFDDDMVYLYDLNESNPDAIMQVYRGDCALGFTDFEDEEPVYERDDAWTRPSAEETKAKNQELLNALNCSKPENNNLMNVIAQQFYGNRTGTTINKDHIDYFLRGELGAEYLARWGEELKMHISCEIPEIGFKLHTRCFACRMDNDGLFQSLEDGDAEKFIQVPSRVMRKLVCRLRPNEVSRQ